MYFKTKDEATALDMLIASQGGKGFTRNDLSLEWARYSQRVLEYCIQRAMTPKNKFTFKIGDQKYSVTREEAGSGEFIRNGRYLYRIGKV